MEVESRVPTSEAAVAAAGYHTGRAATCNPTAVPLEDHQGRRKVAAGTSPEGAFDQNTHQDLGGHPLEVLLCDVWESDQAFSNISRDFFTLGKHSTNRYLGSKSRGLLDLCYGSLQKKSNVKENATVTKVITLSKP